jgi:hypothetical protein
LIPIFDLLLTNATKAVLEYFDKLQMIQYINEGQGSGIDKIDYMNCLKLQGSLDLLGIYIKFIQQRFDQGDFRLLNEGLAKHVHTELLKFYVNLKERPAEQKVIYNIFYRDFLVKGVNQLLNLLEIVWRCAQKQ